MIRLDYSYDRSIDAAYIITIKGNETSERLSKRCQESCMQVGMPYKVWDAYDGTSGNIIEPDHLKNTRDMAWLRLHDVELSITEICCALSHISLWAHCVSIDKPIVILEHDAVVLKKLTEHSFFNSIIYMGCHEQYNRQVSMSSIPVHSSIGRNYHFIHRAHAYAIDPQIAKSMLCHVISNGIHESLDVMIRADLFNIIQPDLYAYDAEGDTTINDRKHTLVGFKK